MSEIAAIKALRAAVEARILGQSPLVDRLLIALLADGHLLVEGAPGLAKTTAIKALGDNLQADFHRLQFTPDLLPSDLIGTDIFRAAEGRFEFQRGPMFHNLLLADEINRAPAKVQSALLEAMEERQVTGGDTTYPLAQPFFVIATQNPIEHEGTWDLPEAQLDRFLMEIQINFPDAETERAILDKTTSTSLSKAPTAFNDTELMEVQALVRAMPIGEKVVDGILHMVRSARPGAVDSPLPMNAVSWGPGPRASQALSLAARARALLDGRLAPSTDDVAALAPAILRHRMALSYTSVIEDGLDIDAAIQKLIGLLG